MTEVLFAKAPKSKKFCYLPGDTRREMTAPAISLDGTTYPAGTVYTPSSAGTGPIGKPVFRVVMQRSA